MPVRCSMVIALLLGASGCGDDGLEARAVPPSASPATPSVATPNVAAAGATGDPLLERAREAIREGALPAEVEGQVLGSDAPAHARARRVLLAMAEPPAEGGTVEPAADAGDGQRLRPPPILPPADPSSVPPPIDRGATKGTEPRATSPAARTPRPMPAPSRGGSASVGRLALRTSKDGATLVIAAPSSLVVGVANQPASGLVRLVIESAKAGDAVLHARPKVEGAAVTEVRQGQGTVQITVRLEPGWTLGSVQPFSGGAKVHLRAP